MVLCCSRLCFVMHGTFLSWFRCHFIQGMAVEDASLQGLSLKGSEVWNDVLMDLRIHN